MKRPTPEDLIKQQAEWVRDQYRAELDKERQQWREQKRRQREAQRPYKAVEFNTAMASVQAECAMNSLRPKRSKKPN